MSLVEEALPARELAHSSQELHSEAREEDLEQLCTYRDPLPDASPKPVDAADTYDDAMFDDYYDDVMGHEPKKTEEVVEKGPAVPELPAKSVLRASRLLDGFGLTLGPQQPASLTQATPQDVYLSSEEDASSSADEFSDYDFESESEESQKSPISRRSHEDTARVVSVVFAGKPCIVELSASRRSISPAHVDQPRQVQIGTSATDPALLRRMSTSSSSTTSFTHVSHPPRSSSMLSSFLGKQRPPFLSIDPFAAKSYDETLQEEQRGDTDTPKTPKTPTAMFKRTMSLVRKRSRPLLNNLANASRDNLTSPSTHTLPSSQAEEPKEVEQKVTEPQAPITYNQIIRAAKKNAQNVVAPATPVSPAPQSPLSPAGTKAQILNRLSMHRRRSMKAG